MHATRFRCLFAFVALLLSGCATVERALPQSRTYAAPIARVKPALVSTLAGLGLRMTSLEARGGREILKARKPGADVEIELESLGRAGTRARVSASTGGPLYDADLAARIFRESGRILGEISDAVPPPPRG